MYYHSLKEIEQLANKQNCSFAEVVARDDQRERQVTIEESCATMKNMLIAMRSADESYQKDKHSASRMAGGDGAKLEAYHMSGKSLSGDFLGKVMERAVKMAETNACMGRIVAAPTAGSCGVLPAVLLTYENFYERLPETDQTDCEQRMIEALYVAAGIGQVIAERASIAGASGGCQAEIGSASAMTAGALTYLRGGTLQQINDAVAISLKSLLGLTCDPIAGLVEVPCIKRNVIGAVNAVTTTDMVMAGVTSVVPADEVIDAMGEIGQNMPRIYRETSEGGLAVTPTAQKVTKKLNSQS